MYLLWIINGIKLFDFTASNLFIPSRARDTDIVEHTSFSAIAVMLLPSLQPHFKSWLSWFIFYYIRQTKKYVWYVSLHFVRFFLLLFLNIHIQAAKSIKWSESKFQPPKGRKNWMNKRSGVNFRLHSQPKRYLWYSNEFLARAVIHVHV